MTKIDRRAGKLPDASMLTDIPNLIDAYYARHPDPDIAAQRVSFGTSGHRGSALDSAFNEDHILAITSAICRYRRSQGINGPLFIGRDTHALSEPAFKSALEILAGENAETMIDAADGYTPTPAISHAILVYNKGRSTGLADGIVITPSHNPPTDGGFKYNPPSGGPADTDVTKTIQDMANQILEEKLRGLNRILYEKAKIAPCIHRHDYIGSYIDDLINVVDMDAIAGSKVRIGIDPLGGAAIGYWQPIIERYKINATILNTQVDPTFRFVPVDHDGKIRMDCSSPFVMTKVLESKDKYDVSFANDTDADRHGIVCASGLMQPNYYLATCIHFLRTHREHWPKTSGVGKTIVSSSMIDRVAAALGVKLYEVPVGFKYFVEGLKQTSLFFGGEESAGSSFLRRDGTVWTTDKDGLIAGLLAAEITAKSGKDPAKLYKDITKNMGESFYDRIDQPASEAQKSVLGKVQASAVKAESLGGDTVTAKLTNAPGNNLPFGGVKLVTENGWFAARPSGTEEIYKIYAESFKSADHLKSIQNDAQAIVGRIFAGG
ncbi:MAG TPA: phosphoglucomutase (alpha-D-glucose-1,6-bisphosphate-dependent) [Rhizomicrobium sp.]